MTTGSDAMNNSSGWTGSKESRSGYRIRPMMFGLATGIFLVITFLLLRQTLNTRVLGDEWESRDLICVEDINHDRWDRLLKKYVDDEGLVRYRAWHSSKEDCAELRDYLELLALAGIDDNGHLCHRKNGDVSGTAHEMAFWINAHNALVVQGILEFYPTGSIRQHSNPLGFDIREHLKLMAGERAYSLNDISRRCLAGFHDPRVRFAMCSASRSCPPLVNRAWTAADVEELLTQCAAGFLNSPANVFADSGGELHLAHLLDENCAEECWQQFGSWRSLASLVGDGNCRRLIEGGTAKIIYIPHDWSLNEKR
jgi:hypothetical protein